jgi:RNA polymerase-binding transcription factor DksA
MKGPIMETTRTERHMDQLRKRREQIAITLRHLGKEQAELESNTKWVSPAAYEKRVRLLARLRRWYVGEIDQIDRALTRAKGSIYGFCMECNELIEERRLDAAPESEFCHACQSRKDSEAEL